MTTPRPHADLIKAWADGETIQFFDGYLNRWFDKETPTWEPRLTYRIKPKPILVRIYYRGNDTKNLCLVSDKEHIRRKALESDENVTWLTPWFNPEDVK